MSTHKIVDHKTGATCGCEYTKQGEREQMSKMCMEHEIERLARHAAAAASCSHINRDLIGA
jgi:hypothetical protein